MQHQKLIGLLMIKKQDLRKAMRDNSPWLFLELNFVMVELTPPTPVRPGEESQIKSAEK